VYLQRSDDNAVIYTVHWKDLRGRVVEELSDDFDQLYVEFIPDIPDS
jgi:hypothetical protein